METLGNHLYNIRYIAANAIAFVMLLCSWKFPRAARLVFFFLFGWACWMNWTYAVRFPNDYLEYADLTFSSSYKTFILGWFSQHVLLMVGCIATCQGLIAISMLLKGWVYKTGFTGGIIFLLAIVPLGAGSGFPCTLVMAVAMYMLWNEHPDYVWHRLAEREIYKEQTKVTNVLPHSTTL